MPSNPLMKPYLTAEIQATETQVNVPIYCTGVALVSINQGNTHVLFYADQPMVNGGNERAANLRVVMPTICWKLAVAEIARGLRGDHGDRGEGGPGGTPFAYQHGEAGTGAESPGDVAEAN